MDNIVLLKMWFGNYKKALQKAQRWLLDLIPLPPTISSSSLRRRAEAPNVYVGSGYIGGVKWKRKGKASEPEGELERLPKPPWTGASVAGVTVFVTL